MVVKTIVVSIIRKIFVQIESGGLIKDVAEATPFFVLNVTIIEENVTET